MGKCEDFSGKKQWHGREDWKSFICCFATAIFFVDFSVCQTFQGTRCVILYPVSQPCASELTVLGWLQRPALSTSKPPRESSKGNSQKLVPRVALMCDDSKLLSPLDMLIRCCDVIHQICLRSDRCYTFPLCLTVTLRCTLRPHRMGSCHTRVLASFCPTPLRALHILRLPLHGSWCAAEHAHHQEIKLFSHTANPHPQTIAEFSRQIFNQVPRYPLSFQSRTCP